MHYIYIAKPKLLLFSKIIMLFILSWLQVEVKCTFVADDWCCYESEVLLYIVFKKLNGLVVIDLEWVWKVHVTFIQELD